MNYRKMLGLLLAITLVPLALEAQPRGGDGEFGGAWGEGPPERGPERRVERMIELLDLSDAQALEIEEILAAQRASRRAAHQDLRADRDALEALLDSDNPDPAAVGQRVLALHAARKAGRAQSEADLGRIRSVLTPEQADKFDVLLEARAMRGERDRHERPGRRGPRGHRRGGRGGDGPHVDG